MCPVTKYHAHDPGVLATHSKWNNSVYGNRTLRGYEYARQHLYGCRFSGAVFADITNRVSGFDIEAHPVNRPYFLRLARKKMSDRAGKTGISLINPKEFAQIRYANEWAHDMDMILQSEGKTYDDVLRLKGSCYDLGSCHDYGYNHPPRQASTEPDLSTAARSRAYMCP